MDGVASEHERIAGVGVEWDEFDALREVVTAAQGVGRLPLSARLGDYFDDCEWSAAEIAGVRAELREVASVPGLTPSLLDILARLDALCDVAIRNGRPLRIIAD